MSNSSNCTQFATALNVLAQHYDKMKTVDAFALELYKKSYKSGCNVARYNYADMLSKTVLEDVESEKMRYPKCLKIIQKYIKLSPEDPDGYYCMGNIYKKMNESIKTRECYLKAVELGKIHLLRLIVCDDSKSVNDVLDLVYTKYIENSQNHKLLTFHSVNYLGLVYSDGLHGIKRDYVKGFKIWEVGVNNGLEIMKIENDDTKIYPTLLYNLGFCYRYGEGVAIDFSKALKLFEKSIELSEYPLTSAYREIGLLYECGYGVKTDVETALKMYTLGVNVPVNPDPVCCLKISKHLGKTQGIKNETNYGPKIRYKDEITKKQSQYIFEFIKSYEFQSDQPKDLVIPFNVLIRWKNKIEWKMKKLKNKITELELRPPIEGGQLYLEAKEKFNVNKNIT